MFEASRLTPVGLKHLESFRSAGEKSELVEARRRIHLLEIELLATRRAMELVRESVPPKV